MTVQTRLPRPAPATLADADLAALARAVLGWQGSLPAGAVHVQVTDGWLTLTGTVRWHYQRQDAIDCLRHLPGVTGIHCLLTLEPAARG